MAVALAISAGCGSQTASAPQAKPAPVSSPATFAQAGDQATSTLLSVFYGGDGLWRICSAPDCPQTNEDWGADSATYALYLRWQTTHDARLVPIFKRLIATAPRYGIACAALPCASWSDVPEWDAIALLREYEAAGKNGAALLRARAAFAFVDDAKVFAIGACPSIRYQIPGGRPGYMLKTLETDANYIKAALLLYEATRDRTYLRKATSQYAAVRRYFLDPDVPLYSVYVYDDGRRCKQLSHRFFASVNGDMMWSGLELAKITRSVRYRDDAVATAKAVDQYLSDARHVFADLQAENDVAEPLVEAMYDLAAGDGPEFAKAWVVKNSVAALAARKPDGTFGRFWDGPPPRALTSIWQSSGGIALEIGASALGHDVHLHAHDVWNGARFVPHPIAMLPATISFSGYGIAFVGTMGKRCCQEGHARVFIDGMETFDRTGIWQNKSMTGSVTNSILFAWRWPSSGHHVIRFEPAETNPKEGGPFLELDGYLIDSQ